MRRDTRYDVEYGDDVVREYCDSLRSFASRCGSAEVCQNALARGHIGAGMVNLYGYGVVVRGLQRCCTAE